MVFSALQTGYFANPQRFTKVHVVESGKPICGSIINDDKPFQWCSHGIHFEYIECEHCKNKLRREGIDGYPKIN